ncbi:MAG: alginate lyase family protein [Synechococcaceae cyanobacterium]|nr:alginate lyase family protein [Synechococcaceae cyanobacterium]
MSGLPLRSSLKRWFSQGQGAAARPAGQDPEAILVRILGNDRPPRRPAGSGAEQLRLLLELEPPLPGLERRWLLNRLVDPQQRQTLIQLLEQHGQPWSEIPFEPQAYAARWTDVGDLPAELHPWSPGFSGLSALEQAQVLDYIARRKHLYLSPRNAARNQALEQGLREAAWVFPWDGDTLLTAEAWQRLRPLLQLPDLACIAVPMAALSRVPARMPPEEQPPQPRLQPQLGFSRLADLRFNPRLRDGALVDLPLLRDLALPGPWLDPQLAGPGCAWEPDDRSQPAAAGRVVQAGWAYRLPDSPAPDAAAPWDDEARRQDIEALRLLARRTEMARIGLALEQTPLRCWTGLADGDSTIPGLAAIASNARHLASRSLSGEPDAGGGGSQERQRTAVGHWQGSAAGESNADRADLLGLGDSSPCGDVSQRYDRARWQLMVDCVCALSLDGHCHGNEASWQQAHRLVQAWFLDPATAMVPDGALARQAGLDPSRNTLEAVVDLRDLVALLDAFTLLSRAGRLTLAERQQLQAWLEAFLGWLSQDSARLLSQHGSSPVCTWYHLLMLAIAAHCGRRNVAAQAFDNLPGLLALQYHPNGAPRFCPAETPLDQTQLFALQAWVNLAVVSAALGRDLLALRCSDGLRLPLVFAHAGGRLAASGEGGSREALGRLQALQRITGLPGAAGTAEGSELEPAALADVSSGLPPFWMLCRVITTS